MICRMRTSDCSTSVGIVLADEATGIWATEIVAEATSAISKATQAFRREKLVDIKFVLLLNCAVSNGSSMIWILQDSPKEPKITLEVTTRIFGVSNQTPQMKHTSKR